MSQVGTDFTSPKGSDTMSQAITFDYFYGGQSDAFNYYRIPRLLITGQQFKGLSTDAKLLYGLLLDRMGLSSRNGWYDELGRVYIYYPLDEVQADLNCGHDKATKLLSELDTGSGEIHPGRIGFAFPHAGIGAYSRGRIFQLTLRDDLTSILH